MRVCVFGCGAIGGLIAARLALAGEDVSVIGRGPHLEAIRRNGIELRWHDGGVQTAEVKAYDQASAAGEQDLVLLAVKAHSLEQVAEDMPHLLGPQTMIMTLQNGIPWWYFYRHGGSLDGTRLDSLDPRGTLDRLIDAKRIVACVVYLAATVTAPGIIRHVEGNHFPMGELDGAVTSRIKAVEAAFIRAELKASTIANIRAEVWLKALGTLSFNPISALTHATIGEISEFPETRRLVVQMMEEARSVAEELGVFLTLSTEQRIARANTVGFHKTSMLQDAECGRPLEIEALVRAILEMGKLTKVATPTIETVYALIRLLDRQLQGKRVGLGRESCANS